MIASSFVSTIMDHFNVIALMAMNYPLMDDLVRTSMNVELVHTTVSKVVSTSMEDLFVTVLLAIC